MSTPNTIPCGHCGADTSWEKTEEHMPSEGEMCIYCDSWVCTGCVDWSFMSHHQMEIPMCKKCTKVLDGETK